ncbi:MAG: hypothetical protein HYW63_04485 [Candidatus Levybacteria bacterium]|nr:hypothetical protein [Candidatus Levybacteria bacterium]
MSGISPEFDQKLEAYSRLHDVMLDPSTPDKQFYDSLDALRRLDKDTSGRVRTIYISKVNRMGSAIPTTSTQDQE